jgi:hypothetical protein
MSVGVRKDKKVKVRDLTESFFPDLSVEYMLFNLHSSHTLLRGGLEHLKIETRFVYYKSIKRVLYREGQYMIVGTMKDSKLMMRGLHVSNTLGYSGDWNT